MIVSSLDFENLDKILTKSIFTRNLFDSQALKESVDYRNDELTTSSFNGFRILNEVLKINVPP